jgi:hypothetical protein
MIRRILFLSIVIMLGVAPGLMILNPFSSASAETPREQRQESPYRSTTTTALPPKDPTATLPQEEPKPDIRPLPITAWGSEVTKTDGTLTLQVRGTEAGDLPSTVQVNFDLCAKKDVVIDDTGYGGPFVSVLRIPSDGVIMDDDYNDYGVSSVIIVDNTPMVTVELTETSKPGDPLYGDAGDLLPVLRKGTCTTTSVEVREADRDNLIFGFAYVTIPFGEFRVDGGFTRLSEGGASQISWEYWENI